MELQDQSVESEISLPEAVAEVVNRHKDQAKEMRKQNEILAKVKVSFLSYTP